MKAKAFFITIILCLGIVHNSFAQIKATSFSCGLGGAYPTAISNINHALEDNGYYAIPNRHSHVNAELLRINNKFLYGADFNLISLMATASGLNLPRNAYYRHFGFVPKIGFSPYVMEDFLYLYPTIGAGVGYSYLKRIPPNTTNGLIITDNVWGLILDGAINVALYNPIPGDNDTKFVIGGAFGYKYTPLNKTWQNTRLKAHNTTETNMSPQGIYFKVWIGMGKS